MGEVTRSFNFDPHSESWRHVAAHIDQRLVIRRTELENPDLTDAETAMCRGAIEELKALKALGDVRPALQPVPHPKLPEGYI